MNKRNKHIVTLNSKDAVKVDKHHYQFTLEDIDLHQVRKIQFKEMSFVNLIYNIYNKNNVLNYEIDSIAKSLVIPEGQYDAQLLKEYIENNQTDFTIDINLLTYKFDITSTGLVTITAGTINDVIGFSTVPVASNNISGDKPFNFVRTNFINVLSNMADADACLSSDKRRHPLICSIPLNLPIGYVVTKSEELDSADISEHYSNINVSEIVVRIVDDEFEPLDLNGGTFILHFSVFK